MRTDNSLRTVRIIGGNLRGSKITVPNHEGLRPSPDRVRETLFNWLQPTIPGAQVLDLFAGTGALSLECLSLDAAHVHACERDAVLAKKIESEATRLQVAAKLDVHAIAAEHFLSSSRLAENSLDLIFIDPPFALDLWQSTIDLIRERRCLKRGGLIYLEMPAGTRERLRGIEDVRIKTAASVEFGLFLAS
jgi:16S rRNA (guanine966-N2)-methyltransferase